MERVNLNYNTDAEVDVPRAANDDNFEPTPQQVMGDPNNPDTWETAPVDAVLEPEQQTEETSDSKSNHAEESLIETVSDVDVEEQTPTESDEVSIREEEFNIYSRFQNDFNIDAQTLNATEGFGELTTDQKEFVLLNLQQTALRQIESEGIVKQRQELAQAPFLKKLWLGVTKGYQLNKQKKAITEDIFNGEVDQTETLTALVDMVAEGPHVTKQEDGSFSVDATSAEDFNGDLSEMEHESVGHFNELASKFNSLPYDHKSGTPEQQDAYEKLEKEYKKARNTLLIIKKGQGASDEEQLQYGNSVDRNVVMEQFMTANPEVETALMNMKNDSVMSQTIKKFFSKEGALTSKGGIFAMGFAGRTATTSLLGAAAIPLVGAGIGLWRGRVDAKEKLTQNELLARSGEAWEQDKSFLDKKYEQKYGKEVANEVRHNIIPAEHLVGKIEKMVERIEEEYDDETREKLLGKLQARISYTEDKIRSNMVNFGKVHNQTGNQLDLLQALGTAKAYGQMPTNKALEERVDRYLGYIDDTVDANQKKFVSRRMFQGAALGAGFAFAGAAAAETVDEFSGEAMVPETNPESTPTEPIIPPDDIEKIEVRDSVPTPTKPDPLGPSDGGPTIKTFISDEELKNHNAPETLKENYKNYTDGEPQIPLSAEEMRDLGIKDTNTESIDKVDRYKADSDRLFNAFTEEFKNNPDGTLIEAQKEIEELDAALPGTEENVVNSNETIGPEEVKAELRLGAVNTLSFEINQTPGYDVVSGDNIWNIIENKLRAHDIFEGFEDGQQTHIIDELKDKVAKMTLDDLREFGYSNPRYMTPDELIKYGYEPGSKIPNFHLIHPGDSLNFSKIMDADSLNTALSHADNLTASQIKNIENYVPPQPDAASPGSSATGSQVNEWINPDLQPDIYSYSEQSQILREQMGVVQYEALTDAEKLSLISENLVRNNINEMYGSEGVFGSGFLGTEGTESVDWLNLKDRTANELLNKQDFPTTDLWGDEIETTYGFDSESSVKKMQKYITKLSKESGLKPGLGETVSKFIHRATEKLVLKQ